MLQSGLYPDGANHVNGEDPPGCFTFGNDEKRCNAGGAVLGSVSLRTALTESSDVYFYSVGNEFWNRYRDEGKAKGFTGDLSGDKVPDADHPVGNAIQHVARTYGFGESTGVGLGDQAGVVPDHDYRVKLNPTNTDLQFWRRGDSASLAVGQGDVLVSPLQLADGYAALANGGTLYTPRLVDEVTQSSAGLPPGQLGPVEHTIDPQAKGTTGLTPDVRQPIIDGLTGVVADQAGTAYGAFRELPRDQGRRQDRYRAGEQRAGHLLVRSDHQPRQRPGTAAVRDRLDGRARRVRRQRVGPNRAAGDRLPEQPGSGAGTGGGRSRDRQRDVQLMSTISPSRLARAQQRTRGLGEPSRLEASPLRHFDWLLVGSSLAITALGLVMIYSTTHLRVPGDPYYFVKRQALFAAVGLVAMVAVLAIDYRRLRDYAMLFYGATVFLLLAVLAPVGSNVKGHQAWFQLPGGFTMQPSELAKFGIIVALAGYCNRYRGELDAWRLTLIVMLVGVPIGLVLLQPDLGTVMVLVVIIVAVLAVAGVSGKQLIVLGLLAITGIYAVFGLGLLKQYQLDRLTVFLDPESGTSQGTAYNLQQSTQTIAHGRLTGEGLDNGSQTQGGFVPEQHTDFIFTSVGEELGFVGAVGAARPVRDRDVAHLANGPALSGFLRRARLRRRPRHARVPDVREHGHDHGHHARHGHPVAVHELWRLVVDHHLRLRRPRRQRLHAQIQLGRGS